MACDGTEDDAVASPQLKRAKLTTDCGELGRSTAVTTLTPEQKARIEQNRQLALARRKELAEAAARTAEQASQPGPAELAPTQLSAEDRQRIEENRQAALERRRQRLEASHAPQGHSPQPRQLPAEAASQPEPQDQALPEKAADKPMDQSQLEAVDEPMSQPQPEASTLERAFDAQESNLPLEEPKDKELQGPEEDEPAEAEDQASSSEESSASDSEGSSSSSADRRSLSSSEERAEEEPEGDEESGSEGSHSEREAPCKEAASCSAGTAAKGKKAGLLATTKPRKGRSPKESLVAELLCRWWYALPPWPPEAYDYDGALAARGFRQVPIQDFEDEEDVIDGLLKVFSLSGWPGLYRQETGELVDVRPVEGRPSKDQLMKRSLPELHSLLTLAYEKQLEELLQQPCAGEEDAQRREGLKKQVEVVKQRAKFLQLFQPKAVPQAQIAGA